MNFIILTGGTNRRFGSDKSAALLNGKSLLETLVDNLPTGDLIIVGPESSVKAKYVREEPIHSGPVAAIGAAISLCDAEVIGIFATDMPFAPLLLPQLEANLKADAALPVDKEGHLQPLAGLYLRAALTKALASFESLVNQSMKSLMEKLIVNEVPLAETELLIDIDTKEALSQAIALQSRLGL